MTTRKPYYWPLNSVYMACNEYCFGRYVQVIIFGILIDYGIKTTENTLDCWYDLEIEIKVKWS